MDIRKGLITHLEALVQFNQAMALETEDKPLSEAVITPGVQALLEDVSRGCYYVAFESEAADADIAGALMVTLEWSDWRNAYFWWIQSVYVRPAWRRKGVYKSLHDHVRNLAREAGNVCGIRLYVERDNKGAQSTYEQLGMAETHYLMYEESL